jgi:translation initiation factor 2 subunit 3
MQESNIETLVLRESEIVERQATHLIGTLGHVSEGKSTIIRALTGIKTQRHQTEQEKNITIHLGYANCKVYQNIETGGLRAAQIHEQPTTSETIVAHLSFVDCPGHEAFLATMLGGASIMDSACLIIAANQEVIPQPQTLEHLIAAHIMGLQNISVIQNKLDLLGQAEAIANYDKIKQFVHDTAAEKGPHFPASAQHGWGIQAILHHLTGLTPPPRHLDSPMRLTCVRSFDVNKPGPWIPGASMSGGVIGGTIQQGVLVVGDWIEIRPGILKKGIQPNTIVAQPIVTRVRGIRCEKSELPYAVPGSLIAIATDLDPGLSIANGMVGQRIGAVGTLPPIVGEIVVRFHGLKRDEHSFSKHHVGDTLRLCSNVMTVEGTIIGIDKRLRRIRLARPLCLDIGENVGILRMNSEAKRELLEGAGEVRESIPWPDIELACGTPPEQAKRIIQWIPMKCPEFNEVAMTYSDMLDAVMAQKEETTSTTKFRIKEPVLERIPKNTIWINWQYVIEALEFGRPDIQYSTHLQSYIEEELSTTSSINGNGQIILKGLWKVDNIRNLLRKYISKYKRCSQCHGYETCLVKEGRAVKIRCSQCRSDNLVL